MKVRHISPHIYKLEFWFLFKISAWLVKDDTGVYIIDTGMSFMAKKIWDEAQKLGNVKGILLTHGHSDHAGGVNHLLKHKVPVYAHEDDIAYMEGKLPFPERKKKENIVIPQTVMPLPTDNDGELASFDSLIPYHTPGHSPGHVIYYHSKDNVVIGGDLFTSRKGKLAKPMKSFTANMKEAVASGAIVSRLKPQLVSIAHGEDVRNPSEQIENYLQHN